MIITALQLCMGHVAIVLSQCDADDLCGCQVDEKLTVEAVRAVLAERWHNPALAAASSRELSRELQVLYQNVVLLSCPACPCLAAVTAFRAQTI